MVSAYKEIRNILNNIRNGHTKVKCVYIEDDDKYYEHHRRVDIYIGLNRKYIKAYAVYEYGEDLFEIGFSTKHGYICFQEGEIKENHIKLFEEIENIACSLPDDLHCESFEEFRHKVWKIPVIRNVEELENEFGITILEPYRSNLQYILNGGELYDQDLSEYCTWRCSDGGQYAKDCYLRRLKGTNTIEYEEQVLCDFDIPPSGYHFDITKKDDLLQVLYLIDWFLDENKPKCAREGSGFCCQMCFL